jgi:hypothetical protein
VCGSIPAQRLPKLDLPEGVEVIVQDHTLSKGGVEMLGRILRRSPQATEYKGLRPPLQERMLKRFIAASGPDSITASTASAAWGTASLTTESIRPST